MKIVAVSVSKTKGVQKKNVDSVNLKIDHGIVGDAHAGDWHRQVSFLAQESINSMLGKGMDLNPGDFAENVTTEGLELTLLKIGARIQVGEKAVLELTQIGKECHSRCAIFHTVGDCVMPREGVFFKVIVEDEIRPGDSVTIL